MDIPISPLQHISDTLSGVAAGAGRVSSHIFLSFFNDCKVLTGVCNLFELPVVAVPEER